MILETQGVNNFSLPQHCFEYLNSMTWFFDNFEHKHQVKLLISVASYLNRAAWHQKGIGDAEPVTVRAPAGADKLTPEQILDRMDAAVLALNGEESAATGRRPISRAAPTRSS